MSGRFALISLAAILCCCRLAAVWGANPPLVPEQLVMLRNGEILRGHVTRQDDHYQVSIGDGELRLRVVDVDLICQTLQEAYQARRARLTLGRAEDHLDLAEWCLRQGLPGEAARELSSALTLDPTNPRIGLVDRRLHEALAPPSAPAVSKKTPGPHVTDEDLDRMLQSSLLPGDRVVFHLDPAAIDQQLRGGRMPRFGEQGKFFADPRAPRSLQQPPTHPAQLASDALVDRFSKPATEPTAGSREPASWHGNIRRL